MGLNLGALMAQADAMTATPVTSSTVPAWSATQLAEAFGAWPGLATTAAVDAYGWHLVSELPDDQAEEVWSPCVIAAAFRHPLPAPGLAPDVQRHRACEGTGVGVAGGGDICLTVSC